MITVKLEGLKEALESMDPKRVNRAASTALAKVAKSAVSTCSAEIRQIYNVKKGDLDPRIKLTPPRADNLTAIITISGRSMSLSYFGAKKLAGARVISRGKDGLKVAVRKRAAKSQGVQVSVLKGKRTQLPQAFMARMKSGHIGVFRRIPGSTMQSRSHYNGTHAEKIAEKAVVSIGYMARSAKVQPVILKKINESWVKIFPHELEYQLGKAMKR